MPGLPIDLAALAEHLESQGYTLDPFVRATYNRPGIGIAASNWCDVWIEHADDGRWVLQLCPNYDINILNFNVLVDPTLPDAIERVEWIIGTLAQATKQTTLAALQTIGTQRLRQCLASP